MKSIGKVLFLSVCLAVPVGFGAVANNVELPDYLKSPWEYSTLNMTKEDWKTLDGKFPDSFLWGPAIAAHQVEGNNVNDWSRFESPSKCYTSGIASDHYRTTPRTITEGKNEGKIIPPYRNADFDMAKDLGMNTFRFSIEWSRIEPVQGEFNEAATNYYRDYLKELNARGLKPMVTLWHFSFPVWVQDPLDMASSLGGWPKQETVEAFRVFAEYCAKNFGDLVDFWVTENEPIGNLMAGWMGAYFPPGHLLWMDYMKLAALNAARAHNLAYDEIKEHDTVDADGDGITSQVGLVKAVRKLKPNDINSPKDLESTKKLEYWYTFHGLDAAVTGKLDTNFDGVGTEGDGKLRLDFIGVNYYSTFLVGYYFLANISARAIRGDLDPVGGCPLVLNDGNSGRPHNSLDWEIYPQGFYDVLMDIHKRYGDLKIPIYITENGMPDPTPSPSSLSGPVNLKRTRFIISHLQMMLKAMKGGVDIRGYYYWTLFDNFEWREGFLPKAHFGLYGLEYSGGPETHPTDTLKRVPRAAVNHIKEIIKENGITADIIRKYGTFSDMLNYRYL